MAAAVDILFLGRIAVDLYGQQRDTPLEETRSFARYPGGSSGNMAIAAARAGASVGLISCVGDDPMGRFLVETLDREGVDSAALTIHPTRRTALAFLGMLDSEADQLDFYRADAADIAIDHDAVPPDYLACARRLAVTGTHLADPDSHDAVCHILKSASQAGVDLVLDIDLRRDLWSGFAGGFEAAVARILRHLPLFSIVVGNQEEVALLLKDRSDLADGQMLVRKLGPDGAVMDGNAGCWSVPGHAIDVINPVGAGDAFLGNLLAASQAGDDWREALAKANAAGALVAARHGCANEMPFPAELACFRSGVAPTDDALRQLQRASRRPSMDKPVLALACDHRVPFDRLMVTHQRRLEDAQHFKGLVFEAMCEGTLGASAVTGGMLMDPRFGADVLNKLASGGYWAGRPVEVTGSRPIAFEAGHDLASDVAGWRPGQVAKVLVWYSPDDPVDLRNEQIDRLHDLQAACRAADIEWMLELVPPLDMPRDEDVLCRGVTQCYEAQLKPDWWKLPALQSPDGWSRLGAILDGHDPLCRGVIVLGLNEKAETLGKALSLAGAASCCRGFAIGRTIFGEAADTWFAGQISDQAAVDAMATLYQNLIAQFIQSKGGDHARPDEAE